MIEHDHVHAVLFEQFNLCALNFGFAGRRHRHDLETNPMELGQSPCVLMVTDNHRNPALQALARTERTAGYF